MENDERENHLMRIYQLIDELDRHDPYERTVIDLIVERKKRQARTLEALRGLPQSSGPEGGKGTRPGKN